ERLGRALYVELSLRALLIPGGTTPLGPPETMAGHTTDYSPDRAFQTSLGVIEYFTGRHIDRLGTWRVLQRQLDCGGGLWAETGHGSDLFHGCRPQLLQGAEVADQCLTPHFA